MRRSELCAPFFFSHSFFLPPFRIFQTLFTPGYFLVCIINMIMIVFAMLSACFGLRSVEIVIEIPGWFIQLILRLCYCQQNLSSAQLHDCVADKSRMRNYRTLAYKRPEKQTPCKWKKRGKKIKLWLTLLPIFEYIHFADQDSAHYSSLYLMIYPCDSYRLLFISHRQAMSQ